MPHRQSPVELTLRVNVLWIVFPVVFPYYVDRQRLFLQRTLKKGLVIARRSTFTQVRNKLTYGFIVILCTSSEFERFGKLQFHRCVMFLYYTDKFSICIVTGGFWDISFGIYHNVCATL